VTNVFLFLTFLSAALPLPDDVLQLEITNLRNRDSVLSLYHNLITGSKDYPIIPYKGFFIAQLFFKAFANQEQRANSTPGPLMEAPSGLVVPPAGSSSAPAPVLTPALSEQAELGALKAV